MTSARDDQGQTGRQGAGERTVGGGEAIDVDDVTSQIRALKVASAAVNEVRQRDALQKREADKAARERATRNQNWGKAAFPIAAMIGTAFMAFTVGGCVSGLLFTPVGCLLQGGPNEFDFEASFNLGAFFGGFICAGVVVRERIDEIKRILEKGY